jgi:hypothetical protein
MPRAYSRHASANAKAACVKAGFLIAIALVAGLHAAPAGAGATAVQGDPAAALQARQADLAGVLARNEFGRPLALQSREQAHRVSGDVYAVVDHPFARVSQAFRTPAAWCEVLILHLNTKYCRAQGNTLSVRMGRKHAQDLDDTYAMRFAFHAGAPRADYAAASATSAEGPLGSHDYRIDMEAVPMANGRSFMRLHYSYAFGTAARLATLGYLATSGSGKVGFSRERGTLVRGMRAAVERNTMRYYLAVDAYLGSLAAAPGRQFATRAERWFDATERYARQLHEIDRGSYLAMKQGEYARQQEFAAQ